MHRRRGGGFLKVAIGVGRVLRDEKGYGPFRSYPV
jgi:hypothetical protein